MTQQLTNSHPLVNALSVDVEEYYHATIFQEAIRGTTTPLESRVERATARLLSLLAEHRVAATFFVLGEVAEAHPDMVKRIARAGHEIACHGYRHELVFRRRPEEFLEDVRRAKTALEDLSGQAVLGFRAPSFSITPASAWAYDALLELGFRYDSSTYPIRHDLYGDATAPRVPHEVRRNAASRLLEVPIGTARLFGMNLPIGGGGYFRLLPLSMVRWGIRYVNRTEGSPVIFYVHPWEFDPGLPRPAMAWRHRFRHYVGISRAEAKLAALIRDVPFTTIRTVLQLPS